MSLVHPRVLLLPVAPTRVITQLPQVKMRFPEPHVNGRFDRRDDLRFSEGNTERAEKRSNHGAVTLWLHSLGQQQARPGAILRYCRAILIFDGSHMKNLSGHAVDISSCSSRACVTMLSLQTARA
jgi:hypothetical protein